jgi:hypothetical protein
MSAEHDHPSAKVINQQEIRSADLATRSSWSPGIFPNRNHRKRLSASISNPLAIMVEGERLVRSRPSTASLRLGYLQRGFFSVVQLPFKCRRSSVQMFLQHQTSCFEFFHRDEKQEDCA